MVMKYKYVVFYLTDCSGSTCNLILPHLYIKDFSGNIFIKLLTDWSSSSVCEELVLIIT